MRSLCDSIINCSASMFGHAVALSNKIICHSLRSKAKDFWVGNPLTNCSKSMKLSPTTWEPFTESWRADAMKWRYSSSKESSSSNRWMLERWWFIIIEYSRREKSLGRMIALNALSSGDLEKSFGVWGGRAWWSRYWREMVRRDLLHISRHRYTTTEHATEGGGLVSTRNMNRWPWDANGEKMLSRFGGGVNRSGCTDEGYTKEASWKTRGARCVQYGV